MLPTRYKLYILYISMELLPMKQILPEYKTLNYVVLMLKMSNVIGVTYLIIGKNLTIQ